VSDFFSLFHIISKICKLLVKGGIDVVNSPHKSLLVLFVPIFPYGKRSDGSDTLAEESTSGLLKGKFTEGHSLDTVIGVDTIRARGARVEEATTRRHLCWEGRVVRV
jgi:hypothetical protein